MTTDIIIALITVSGTALSAFFGIIVASRLTNFRLEQLEKKVGEHNHLDARIVRCESRLDGLEDRRG